MVLIWFLLTSEAAGEYDNRDCWRGYSFRKYDRRQVVVCDPRVHSSHGCFRSFGACHCRTGGSLRVLVFREVLPVLETTVLNNGPVEE